EAVGVHVIDFFGADTSLPHGAADRPRQAGAAASAIKGSAETDNLSINASAAPPRVLQLLERQHAGPFADDQAVAMPVERPAGFFRPVAAQRQRLEQTLTHQAERVDFAVGAADQEEVSLIAADDPVRFAKGQQAG